MALGVPFGKYRLVRRIARGGMAEVFLAWQLGQTDASPHKPGPVPADDDPSGGFSDDTTGIRFVRQVAVKRILPHLSQSDEFRALFLSEARLAATLSHPNAVHIYDYGRTAECLYLAMELIDGVDLLNLIRNTPPGALPIEHALRIAVDALAGLHHAHTRTDSTGRALHIVHRDVSPQNLMITRDGVVKVLDFGIAKAAWSEKSTRPGVVRGKYAYMSPEQIDGQRLDPRSDVYSLGVCLFELLTGAALLPRELPLGEALKTLCDGGALAGLRRLPSLRPDVPAQVHAILRRALSPRRDDRYDSAAEMQLDVERFLKGWPHLSSAVLLAEYLRTALPAAPPPSVAAPATATGDWAGESTPVVPDDEAGDDDDREGKINQAAADDGNDDDDSGELDSRGWLTVRTGDFSLLTPPDPLPTLPLALPSAPLPPALSESTVESTLSGDTAPHGRGLPARALAAADTRLIDLPASFATTESSAAQPWAPRTGPHPHQQDQTAFLPLSASRRTAARPAARRSRLRDLISLRHLKQIPLPYLLPTAFVLLGVAFFLRACLGNPSP